MLPLIRFDGFCYKCNGLRSTAVEIGDAEEAGRGFSDDCALRVAVVRGPFNGFAVVVRTVVGSAGSPTAGNSTCVVNGLGSISVVAVRAVASTTGMTAEPGICGTVGVLIDKPGSFDFNTITTIIDAVTKAIRKAPRMTPLGIRNVRGKAGTFKEFGLSGLLGKGENLGNGFLGRRTSRTPAANVSPASIADSGTSGKSARGVAALVRGIENAARLGIRRSWSDLVLRCPTGKFSLFRSTSLMMRADKSGRRLARSGALIGCREGVVEGTIS